MDQISLLRYRVEFNDKSRQKWIKGKNKKRDTYESAHALYEGWELTLNAFKREHFQQKKHKEKKLKY